MEARRYKRLWRVEGQKLKNSNAQAEISTHSEAQRKQKGLRKTMCLHLCTNLRGHVAQGNTGFTDRSSRRHSIICTVV
eukprot:1700977-Amphidinium_carterae.1